MKMFILGLMLAVTALSGAVITAQSAEAQGYGRPVAASPINPYNPNPPPGPAYVPNANPNPNPRPGPESRPGPQPRPAPNLRINLYN